MARYGSGNFKMAVIPLNPLRKRQVTVKGSKVHYGTVTGIQLHGHNGEFRERTGRFTVLCFFFREGRSALQAQQLAVRRSLVATRVIDEDCATKRPFSVVAQPQKA